jgi:hypothetical protein
MEREKAVNQLWIAEAGSWGWGQFKNLEEGEGLPLAAANKQRSEDCGWED